MTIISEQLIMKSTKCKAGTEKSRFNCFTDKAEIYLHSEEDRK